MVTGVWEDQKCSAWPCVTERKTLKYMEGEFLYTKKKFYHSFFSYQNILSNVQQLETEMAVQRLGNFDIASDGLHVWASLAWLFNGDSPSELIFKIL